MKILHIISQSPDFTGSGKFIQEIIRQSAINGHDNFLVAGVQADFKMPGALIDKDHCIFVRFDGKDIDAPIPGMSDVMPYQSRIFSKLCETEMIAYQRAFEKKIKQAVDTFQPDILHTHHLWVVSALARKIAPQIPMVTTCHGTCLRQHYLCPNVGRQITKDLQKIDQIIALSCDQKQNIVNTIHADPLTINVISGGYNKDFFFYEPKTFHGVVELVYAGKLSSAKGVPWLLKSLERIKDLPFRLHMAGTSSGSQKEMCLALAGALGSKVVYHGPLSHEKLGELMRRSHIFVLPSFYEGLPLVLMEALACGCRIITTALPGVKEIFGSDHGFMVRMIELPKLETIDTPYEKDKNDLENRLSGILKQGIKEVIHTVAPDMEYVRSATFQFAWKKIFSRIETVYDKVFSEHANHIRKNDYKTL
ncbi:MAG: glycosyltransferase family 4 protein [Proteobacteria bacterium]|nr:glycosyltransferase family 4 protein [Pseudomonadota bacterium]MBU1584422.1 glycosyltransferase family 4 protein [Pseudomonadota bacterium]MBU2454324.1 glycosyltransferase family 4 protein [Pseudomonadota bacterium]MBU2630408.1 glycosyltransferase family 4 protein [Pseudomonadota bacterium]